MSSAARALIAAQVELATTATPCWMPVRTGTVAITPGWLRARVSSKRVSFAPSTGARSMLAYTMFGTRTSIPY